MEYHYLDCDGPDCGQKRHLRNPPASQVPWITITGVADNLHFCGYDCLRRFTADDDAPDKTVNKYADHLGIKDKLRFRKLIRLTSKHGQ